MQYANDTAVRKINVKEKRKNKTRQNTKAIQNTFTFTCGVNAIIFTHHFFQKLKFIENDKIMYLLRF